MGISRRFQSSYSLKRRLARVAAIPMLAVFTITPSAISAPTSYAAVQETTTWTDTLQAAKHQIYAFAKGVLGERFGYVGRNTENQIVVAALGGVTDAEQNSISRYSASLGVAAGSNLVYSAAPLGEKLFDQVTKRLPALMIAAAALGDTTGSFIYVDLDRGVIHVQGPTLALEALRAAMPDDMGIPAEYAIAKPMHPLGDCTGGTATSPSPNRCNRPIRGGQWEEGCTAGFIVRSDSDNKPYMLTAGHCVAEPFRGDGTKYARYLDNSLHGVGSGHNTSYFYAGSQTGPQGDAGIVNLTYSANTPGQWGTLRAWVLVRAGFYSTGGAPAPGTDEQYYMSAAHTTISDTIDDRVCKTGTTEGLTWCGKVTSTGGVVDYGSEPAGIDGKSHHIISGISGTNICSHPGDSGGPVFALHEAYGTVSGGPEFDEASCEMLFYPILYGLADLNVHLAVGT